MSLEQGSTELLVGRATERDELRRALDAAVGGTGSVVLVSGPAGIGKTRVVERLADDARAAGVPVRWGRCPAEEGAPPLWPWRRALALDELDLDSAAPASTGPDEAAAARFRLLTAVGGAVTQAAAPAGLVVVLEDLHWADSATLTLLRHVAADVRRSRVLVLGTFRDGVHGPLDGVLPDLLPLPGVRLLALPPLSAAGVAAYLSTVFGAAVDRRTVAVVHERSGGNPLYVRTVVRVLANDLLAQPPDAEEVGRRLSGSSELRHLVAAALRPLEAADRQVLAVASVLGEQIDAPLLAQVAGLPTGDVLLALDRCGDAGLVSPVPDLPGAQRFAHALVRDGVYADLGAAARLHWHARAAEVLEQQAQLRPGRAGEVAFHWLRAATGQEELRRAVRWARTAAAQAVVLAPEEAARLAAAALAAADRAQVTDAERSELLLELAAAEYRAGRMASSLEHCRAAADAAARADRGDLLAGAALVLQGVGHPSTATALMELCDRALAHDRLTPALTARLLAHRALGEAELGHFAAAVDGSVRALEAADACGDVEAVLAALHARVNVLDATDPPGERHALATRALRVASADRPLARLWAHLWRLDAAYHGGDAGAVDEEIFRMEALVADTGLPLARWHLLRARAVHAALQGRLADARAANDEAGAVGVELQDHSAVGMSNAFRYCLAALTGDPAELGPDWAAELEAAPPLPVVTAARAGALLLLGRRDEATALYESLLPGLRRLPRDGRWHGTLDPLVELAEALHDLETAEVLHALLLPVADRLVGRGAGNMWVPGSAWRPVGRLAAMLGRRVEAAQALERAVAADVRLGARPYVVHDRVALAQVLAEADPARARRCAADAAAEARRLGLPGPLLRADRLLAALSAEARAADPLTRREREVAELVAQSLSNRQVADRLVLSERTVESHLRSILAKLGGSRRTDVVRFVLAGDVSS